MKQTLILAELAASRRGQAEDQHFQRNIDYWQGLMNPAQLNIPRSSMVGVLSSAVQAAGSGAKDTMREGPAMTSRSCDRDVITGPALIPILGPEAAACTAHKRQDYKSSSEVEAVQNNPILLMEGSPAVALQRQDGVMETSIPVPVLSCQDTSTDVVQFHGAVFVENASPSSPITAPHFRGYRRASEISIASQVSGMADSYTASNIANKSKNHLNHSKKLSLLSQLALPYKPNTKTSSPTKLNQYHTEQSHIGRMLEKNKQANKWCIFTPQHRNCNIKDEKLLNSGNHRIDRYVDDAP
ncbi:unnamed protein product [Ranitomeya imitator]|uniref:Uncharacterized protein n=1 Tax=Ranitomeya imitator TaxID=111125 RepID=A0ABN9M7K2_9NEOB|nr:unnamed protein product [Ranitomeya imitator]